ncbi:MAG: PAS domain-containing protein, partial [Bacteroidia bacterium]
VQAADNILWADFFSPEYLNLWRELYMQALSGKHIKEEIYTPEMENLPKVWLEATLNPIYDGEKIIGVACHSRNITKRKRRKANLLEMNRKLETAESLTHIGYFERDLKSGSLFFSNELYNIFGLNAEDGIDAHRFYKLIYPEDMHKFINARQEALDTRTTTSAGFRIKRKDKSIRHVVIRITTEEDAKGNAVKLAGAIQDITESKMAHEKAEEYLKHLNIIFENTIDDFVLTDVNGFIKAFNATASETFLLNVNKELRIGESIYHYVELDRTLDFGIVFSKVLQGETFRYDMDYNRPEGKVWFNLSIRPVYTDNKINGVCITGRDVTERKAAEEQVVRNEKRFRALIESSEDAMVMLDEDLKVIYQSPSTKRILGFSFAEMKDKLWIENIHPDHRASVTEFMRDVLEKPGTPQFHIYRIKHKSGSWIWSEGTVTNFLQNEHIQAFVFNFRNVTDSMIHMRNIERQNEALREIAWMQSHVVRAPLARIMGLVNHLKSNFSQELQKDNVLGYLLSATYELDAVIKSIIKKTEQVENLTSPDKDITD